MFAQSTVGLSGARDCLLAFLESSTASARNTLGHSVVGFDPQLVKGVAAASNAPRWWKLSALRASRKLAATRWPLLLCGRNFPRCDAFTGVARELL